MTIPTSRIRVLIADVPGVFAHMLKNLILAQQDMTLIGQVEGSVQVLLAASQGADVVILGTSQLHPPPGMISHLLSAFPSIKILLLSPHEDAALGFWLGVHSYPVHTLSEDRILKDVRHLHALIPTL